MINSRTVCSKPRSSGRWAVSRLPCQYCTICVPFRALCPLVNNHGLSWKKAFSRSSFSRLPDTYRPFLFIILPTLCVAIMDSQGSSQLPHSYFAFILAFSALCVAIMDRQASRLLAGCHFHFLPLSSSCLNSLCPVFLHFPATIVPSNHLFPPFFARVHTALVKPGYVGQMVGR